MRAAIRPAAAADYPAFTSLFGELGDGEQTPPLDRWTSELMFHTLVAEAAGVVRGYVSFYRVGKLGHVRDLVVTREARNRGVGHTLMSASAASLRAAGAVEWHSNVKPSNAAAIWLYEKLGMRAEHRSTVLRMTWQVIAALPVELATIAPLTPEEDDEVERAFAMASGRIAMARRPGRVLVHARDRDCAVAGVAVFDPDFPGVTPFRARTPQIAATLLAGLRGYAVHDSVQLVIENDDALGDALADAGAVVRLRLLHYSGQLG